jgi:hypothetical protein
VFTIDGYDATFTMGNTGRVGERAWISDVQNWSVSVDELNGTYAIDDLTLTILDINNTLTKELSTLRLAGLRATLRFGVPGVDLANYVTLFAGIATEPQRNKDGTYTFTCQDFNRLTQRLVYLTGDKVTTTTATTTLTGNVYTVNSTIVVTDKYSGNVLSTTTDTQQTLNGTVGTVVTTDAAAISTDNIRRVVGHPLDILLDIMLDQVGFSEPDVNVDQIISYRDDVLAGVEFDFKIDKAVDAKDFMENQLLKPLGGYMYPDNTGRMCVGFMQPDTGALLPVMDINPYNLVALVDLVPQTLVNVLTMRFDKDDDGISNSSTGYLSESNTFYAPSIADINDLTGQIAVQQAQGSDTVQGQLIIESDGIRSGFQGYLLSKMVANSIFSKYGNYNPSMDPEVFWQSAFRLMIGDFVTVTHPLLVDRRSGTVGMVAARYQVIKRSYDFSKFTVSLTINDASGIRTYSAHRIAPDGKPAYGAGSDDDHARYIYMAGANGTQINGDAAATLG